MEHGAVRRVRLVGAVHAAEADDADGRLARGHDARLNGRGVRAQHHVVVNIECILRVARRMVLGNVHQFEVVVIQFNLRPLDRLEAHAGEDVQQLLQHDRHRMQAARRTPLHGHRHVNLFIFQALFQLAFSDFLLRFADGLFQLFAGFVHPLTDFRTHVRGHLTHAAQNASQLALLAEHAHAHGVQRLGIIRAFQLFQGSFQNLVNLFPHGSSPSPSGFQT